MVNNDPINRSISQSTSPHVGGVQPGGKPAGGEKTEGSGPAFQVLLEKLQQKAQSLQAESEAVDKPEDLSGAVNRARVSLNDALSLSDQLLEAYREATHNDSTNQGGASDA